MSKMLGLEAYSFRIETVTVEVQITFNFGRNKIEYFLM